MGVVYSPISQVDAAGRLTNAGSTISVPLSSGITALTITGVEDGGGGITMQFSTSRGDYFAQDIAVGQQIHLGVSAP